MEKGIPDMRLLSIICVVAAAILFPVHVGAGQSATPETARQREILRELETFRPPGVDAAGVWMLAEWDSDAGLDTLAPLPDNDGNAAYHFKRLEDLYQSEKDFLDDDGPDPAGVAALLDAARLGGCRLTPEYYPPFDSTEAKQPDFVILRSYLQALLRRAARMEREGDRDAAEECFRSALVCGRHLTADKTSSIVYLTGLIFKLRGAQEYEAYLLRAGDAARMREAKRYGESVAVLLRACMWKANVALSEFEGFACLPAAVRIATGDAEPFWRKEAVARLALLRHGVLAADASVVARNQEYEKAAEEALTRIADSDPDPSVRRFAIWSALNLRPDAREGMEHRFAPAEGM